MTPYRLASPRRPTNAETMAKYRIGMAKGRPWQKWDALGTGSNGLLLTLICIPGPHPFGGLIDIPCGLLGLGLAGYAAFRYWRETPRRRLVEEAEAELDREERTWVKAAR